MKVILGGKLIDPAQNIEGDFDILVDGDKVSEVRPCGGFSSLNVPEKIDASGKWVVPGLVDLHVHLREPGFEWKETVETGTRAALLGGYTSIACMANTRPVNDSAEISRFIIEQSKKAGYSKVYPIGAVTLGLKGKEMSPLSEMAKAGCVAFSDDGEPVYDAGLMRRALEWCLALDAPIACHEEDKCLSCGGAMNESALSTRLGLLGWPKVAEEVMIARDIELARATGGKVHICHVSTARGVELIRRAKNDGIKITAEVTPHHLVLTEEAVSEYDTDAKMSPPLRESGDLEALIAGLIDGTIDCVASDHAPHDPDSKRVEFSKATFGILGLQTSLPLLLDFVGSGKLKPARMIEALSSEPAKIFKLGVGTLKKGSPADIVLIDPNKTWTFSREVVASKSFNSPFFGRKFKGAVDTVLLNGIVKLQHGIII